MADRDPPHRVVFVPARAQPGAVHHILGYSAHSGRTAGDPRGRRASSNATPAWRTPLAERIGGSRSRPTKRRKSRLPFARSGGSRSGGGRSPAMICGRCVFPASGTVQVADQPGHVLAARADLSRSPLNRPGHRTGRRNAIRASRPRGTSPVHSGGPGPCGKPARNAIRAGAGSHPVIPGPRGDRRIAVPVAQLRGWPGDLFRRSSPAASSRAARRSLFRCHDHAPRHRQGCFGGERAACQPGLAGGVRHLGVLLIAEREPYRPAAPALVPGAAARPGTGRLAVATNLVVVKNVRHEPMASSGVAGLLLGAISATPAASSAGRGQPPL